MALCHQAWARHPLVQQLSRHLACHRLGPRLPCSLARRNQDPCPWGQGRLPSLRLVAFHSQAMACPQVSKRRHEQGYPSAEVVGCLLAPLAVGAAPLACDLWAGASELLRPCGDNAQRNEPNACWQCAQGQCQCDLLPGHCSPSSPLAQSLVGALEHQEPLRLGPSSPSAPHLRLRPLPLPMGQPGRSATQLHPHLGLRCLVCSASSSPRLLACSSAVNVQKSFLTRWAPGCKIVAMLSCSPICAERPVVSSTQCRAQTVLHFIIWPAAALGYAGAGSSVPSLPQQAPPPQLSGATSASQPDLANIDLVWQEEDVSMVQFPWLLLLGFRVLPEM